jgi:hypothetical protein
VKWKRLLAFNSLCVLFTQKENLGFYLLHKCFKNQRLLYKRANMTFLLLFLIQYDDLNTDETGLKTGRSGEYPASTFGFNQRQSVDQNTISKQESKHCPMHGWNRGALLYRILAQSIGMIVVFGQAGRSPRWTSARS